MDDRMGAATEEFAEHRELLFSIAYNILGTVTDTEDALQETWLSWAGADRGNVGNTRAYLVRIAVNEAIGRLRGLERSRETYVGPWLPEPLVDAAGRVDGDAADASARALQAESISLAMMVVLETLTPLERAVFVLREAFGYSHAEIAQILDRTPDAVRQLAHRAREHVQARRPRLTVDPAVRQAVTERFLAAAIGGDLVALMDLLAPDVAMWTDGGGKTRAALRVVTGRDKVARLLTAQLINAELAGLTMRFRTVNGEPAALLYDGDRVYAVGVVTVADDGAHVRGIYGILNPDKLRRISPPADPPHPLAGR